MYRHHPQWQLAKRLVNEGGIGELRTIQTMFSYFLDDPTNIRNMADIGGGGLMDIGCYAISLSRFLFDDEPGPGVRHRRVRPRVENRPAGLSPDGFRTRHGHVHVRDADRPIPAREHLRHGWPHRDRDPLQRPAGQALQSLAQTGEHRGNRLRHCRSIYDPGRPILAGRLDDHPVPTPIEDAVANMRVIEAIFKSDESGDWEVVAHTSLEY